MKILAIDYGRSKIGLATAEGPLAGPWKVVGLNELNEILKKEKFDKLVVGVSSGTMAEEQKKFAKNIGAETFDETLTTKEAQRLSLEAGMGRKKRRDMEDAFAAALMLQSYLDSNV
ncbi:MAG: RuvX/YqgF family protein [Patescibacteria group bacterium]